MELKSFWVPAIVFAILILFIPFRIEHHSIITTQYIFGSLMSAVILMRVVDIATENHHAKIIDYILTPIILTLSLGTLIPIGIIAIIIGLIFPRSLSFVGWLVSTIVLFVLGVRMEYFGKVPNLNRKHYVFIANHSSFLDYFLIAHIMGPSRKWKIVYGTNLEKYPIFGYFIKKKGIGVDRSSEQSRMAAYKKMRKALDEGYSLAIFPEGTRMRSHQMDQILLPFNEGAFQAAVKSDVHIIPIVFDWPILYSAPDKPWLLSPHTIRATVLPHLVTHNHNAEKVMEHAHEVMLRELTK